MISEGLEKYILRHSSKEDDLLHEIHRKTHLQMIYPRMISGSYQGVLLEMISKMVKPKKILEIGTFTAYSTICLAKGLDENGQMITIDINAELEIFIQKYLKKAGVDHQVKCLFGDAKEILPQLDDQFDLVFIDADKENYLNYYQLVFEKVKNGGFILADNVLWDGKVLKEGLHDKETQGIIAFNEFVSKDERVQKIMLPIRDGLYLINKL